MTDNDPHLANGLLPGVLTGLLATVAGAAGYGALIAFSGYEIGFAAIGVGLLVGFAMIAVRPASPVLPPLAALLSLVGAALGQVVGSAVGWARASGEEYGPVFVQALDAFPEDLRREPISLLFWVVAAYVGFSFVNRRVKSAREAHDSRAASSVPQPDEAADRVNYFEPRKQP
ncbi:hypothetical protein GCM10022252_53760 [Streptosporangium oxazolinicum]|uniref:Uncharacterized protein n=1 Tax=Streptosporangium oxazolinicum TaxID=909287 RepID=A0ABP8B8J6_9ACTN